MWNLQGSLMAKTILKRKNKVGKQRGQSWPLSLPISKHVKTATVIKSVELLKEDIYPVEHNRDSRNKLLYIWSNDL